MLIFAQDAWNFSLKETMGAGGDLPWYKLSIWFGRKPCIQTFTKKKSHLVEVQKVNPKTLHRKIQPTSTSSIIFNRWFPSWKRRLSLKNRVFLNLPKGITIFKGLAFLASGRAPTIFHWVEFSIEEPAFPSPFPPFFHPHPGWPTGPTCDPFRHGRHLIALSRQGRPWRLQGGEAGEAGKATAMQRWCWNPIFCWWICIEWFCCFCFWMFLVDTLIFNVWYCIDPFTGRWLKSSSIWTKKREVLCVFDVI